MLLTFLTAVHLVVALAVIFFVLLQDPKGGGAMGVFGGGSSSNSLFGSTGAGNFLTKITKGAAVLFAVLCIALTYVISHPGDSVLDKTAPVATPAATPAELPAQPAGDSTEVPPASGTEAPAAPTETK